MLGAIEHSDLPKFVWIRVVDLPLQFWPLNISKAIRDYRWWMGGNGGRDPTLKPSKWTGVKVKGDGTEVPKVVTLEEGGISYACHIWVESPVCSDRGRKEGAI